MVKIKIHKALNMYLHYISKVDSFAMTLVRFHPGMYILLKQRQFHTTEQILANNFPVLTIYEY